jgi:hypothetical protein
VRAPLCLELFAGTFGWSAGWLEMGGRAIGFDIEHLPHHGPVPAGAELVLQDVLTLDGAQFRDASLILASPPCQAYSYRAMPWKRAKALPPPDNALFDACFRIQREASEAAGHHIPMVVENVKGAQPWVGRAAWHYGSFYLWGDVPALMPFSNGHRKLPGDPNTFRKLGIPSEHWTNSCEWIKNSGGSRCAISSPGQKETGRNPVHEGIKQHGSGAAWFDKALDERRREATATKMQTAGVGLEYGGGFGWDGSAMRTGNSKSSARKAASAQIARIPLALSRWIARCYFPEAR